MKVTAMINDNLTRDTEPGDNLIEYEEGNNLPIGFHGRHGFDPLSKVVDDHDNMLIPPNQSWIVIYKVYPPLGEGTDDNDWVKRGWVQGNFLSEHLEGVTLLNHFNTIFKDSRPEISSSQDFLGCRKPG
jgi:hypothetical protein